MVHIPKLVAYPLVGACGYGALLLVAGRALYHPLRYPLGLWDEQGDLGARDVWLNAGGVRLHAWWVERAGAPLATLFLHGNAGNLSHRVAHLREISAAGSSVLILDYRGYGKSRGFPTERGLYADAEAAYQHLRGAGLPIVVHGESLGTAVATYVASRNPCAGVILEAAFTSARDVAGLVLPYLGPLLIFGYDSARRIDRIGAPLLAIHGGQDDLVPPEMARSLVARAREPKSFWLVPGAGHNNLVETAGGEYRRRLSQFYESLR